MPAAQVPVPRTGASAEGTAALPPARPFRIRLQRARTMPALSEASAEPPTLRAWLIPTSLDPLAVVWCPACRCYHVHGPTPGWRYAHCCYSAAFVKTGYVLEIV